MPLRSFRELLLIITIVFSALNPVYAGKAQLIEDALRLVSEERVVEKAVLVEDALRAVTLDSKFAGTKKRLLYADIEDGELHFSTIESRIGGESKMRRVSPAIITTLGKSASFFYDICIEPEVYFSKEFAGIKDNLYSVDVIYHDLSVHKIIIADNYLEITPSLGCKITDLSRLNDALALNTWELKKSDCSIASVLDLNYDQDVDASLRKLSKANSIAYNILTRDNLESVFKKAKHKFLLLTGHFENNSFFAKGFGESPEIFTLEEITKLKEKYNVYVFSLGCSTAKINFGAGFLKDIYDVDLVNQLGAALNANTFTNFISCLGTAENPLILTSRFIRGERVELEFSYTKAIGKLEPITVSLSVPLDPPGAPTKVDKFVDKVNIVLLWCVVIIGVIALLVKKVEVLIFIPYLLILYGLIRLVCYILNLF
jgi:hypothetical protein